MQKTQEDLNYYDLDGEKIVFEEHTYVADGTPAISVLCLSEDGNEECPYFEPYGMLTVCIPDEEVELQENQILVKTWSENEVLTTLLENGDGKGLFKNTGEIVPTGFVFAEIWEKTENYFRYLVK